MSEHHDNIARLLSAASHATDRSTRLAYLSEARAALAREAERHRDLALLCQEQERELTRMAQQELIR